MTTVIQANALSFSYDLTPTLCNLFFEVKKGEFIGVIGPNGGGKTTLLKLILGLLVPTSGKIEVWQNKNQIAYVPQSTKFDKQFPISVIEVVLSGLLHLLPWHGFFSYQDKKKALDALDQVNLTEFAHHCFGELSGGQAQRVLIARAIVQSPELLLLDEPTASVDYQAKADIYEILQRIRGKVTLMMVTHDLGAATSQVDRLFCVQKSLFSLKPDEGCKRYTMGLYQDPNIPLKAFQ